MPSAVGFAHLGRPLLVAEALRRRGHEVVFAYGGAHRGLLDDLGYACHPLPDIQATDFAADVHALWTPALVEEALEQEAALLDRLRPAAVLADFRPTAAISSRRAGIPLVSLRNAYLTDDFDLAALLIDRQRHPLRYRAARPFVSAIQSRQKRSAARTLVRAARRRGLSRFRSLFDFFTGDLDLLADAPGFFPLRAGAAPHFVGPLVWEGPPGVPAPPLPPAPPGVTTLYATAGHTGDPALLERVAAAFAGVDSLRVILATGRVDPERYRGLPGIHAFAFFPGSAAAQASAAAIHCAGNGTTYQCLRAGCPAVVLPSNNDQEINARALARQGAGLALRADRTDAARLRAAVAQVVQMPGYRREAERLRDAWRGLDGAESAAEAIVGFLGA
jgi:UDP:flavonoid glycosyltransferase YjiC (YdhE family)